MTAPVIQFLRGSSSKISNGIVSFRAGEPGITTDKGDFYIGSDGTSSGNMFFGSYRYWIRETDNKSAILRLVSSGGDTTNSIHIKSPDNKTGITTYTLPASPVAGNFLKVDASGNMVWSAISDGGAFSNGSFENSTFTGISTFNSFIDANSGINVVGGSEFDNINVTGIATVGTTLDVNGLSDLTNVNVSVAATIASADINGGTIDGTSIGSNSASRGNFTHLTYSSSSTSGITTVGAFYIGSDKVLSIENTNQLTLSGIDAIDSVTKATLESTLALTPNNFDDINVSGISTFQSIAYFNSGLNVTSGISTFANLIDANGGIDVFGHSELDNINVSGFSTFVGLVDINGGVNVSGGLIVDNINASGVTTLTTLNVTGNITLGSDGTDTLTVNANANFVGTLTGTISTATRSTQIDTVETTNNSTYYIPFVSNDTSTSGETLRVDGGISYNPSTNTLDIPVIETASIKHESGTNSITIDSFGNVGFATNVTVSGNLNVLGSTTTVNTESLLVKDSIIEVGMVDSSGVLIPPTTDSNIDVGMVFHYFSGTAKKAAVYWDDSISRIAFASDASESNSIITANTYATILAGGLEINNSCTGGTSAVISCVGSDLSLSNIVIDAGTF